MKKTVFIAVLCGLMASMPVQASWVNEKKADVEHMANAQKPKDSFAKIEFDKVRADMGEFPSTDPIRKTTFTFTNTGTAPLVIHQALASCGCTVPTYPKTPIKPGEKGTIEVTYNGTGKFPGHFQKTITIRTNATNEVVRLTIEGDMTEK